MKRRSLPRALRRLRHPFLRYEYELRATPEPLTHAIAPAGEPSGEPHSEGEPERTKVVRCHPGKLARQKILFAGQVGAAPWDVRAYATKRQARKLGLPERGSPALRADRGGS